jgi:adenylate cyclase
MAEEPIQRRLAGILAVDAVGYSRLMGVDEVGTFTLLKIVYADLIVPKITKHQGRIVKEMGDGLLVEFASVVEAVQCAVETQQVLNERNAHKPEDQQLTFRMGVNLGDIIVDGDDIFGEGVNIAARLEGLADPGGIVVSGEAYRQIENKMDIAFEDLGEHQLKNIVQSVRVYRFKTATRAVTPRSVRELLERPALAVLPLVNISGDSEQEYLADGLTEDIITALSNCRSFPVISRNSTFTYKGLSVDVRTIASILGARYVLEGSIRKGGERIRISAQLIDAATGHHVWAEKFDRTIEDMFELQDEITQKIAATAAPELERAERKRVASHTPDPNAWDFYHRGMSFFYQGTKESGAKSREYFERAIEVDPSYSRAYAGLALSYHDEVGVWHDPDRDGMLAKSLAAAQRSVGLDDTDSYAQTMMGNVQMRMGQHDPGIAHCRRAIALNPSNALAHIILGNALAFFGQPKDGISSIETGIRLNPEDPNIHYFVNILARAHLTAGNHNEAIGYARDSINLRSSNPWPYLILASALGHLGKVEEAMSAIAECERLEPGRTAFEFEELPRIHRNFDDAEHILDGIRKAGWSE